jgi:hypothetical protein
MKLKLVAAISGLVAIGALAHAQQAGPQPKIPKPTLADAQNVVQIVTSDKVKSQAYCDLTKLEGQVEGLRKTMLCWSYKEQHTVVLLGFAKIPGSEEAVGVGFNVTALRLRQ